MESYDYNNVGWQTEDQTLSESSAQHFNNKSAIGSVDETNYPTVSLASNNNKSLQPIQMTITITEPKKESEGTNDMHISYLVTVETDMDGFIAGSNSLRRRFQDFVGLHQILNYDLQANVIPPLPEKHRMEYLTGDRFSEDFIEKRRVSLERFMNRIAIHPTLQKTAVYLGFLKDPEWSVKEYEEAFNENTVLESLSDSIVNAFSKLKQKSEQFELIKQKLDRFEKDLATVDKIHQKIIKRKADIHTDYLDLSNSLIGLSQIETNLMSILNTFSNTLNTFAAHIVQANKLEDIYYLSHLREYIAYCHKVKNVLKLRDQKQVDFEELTDYLALQVNELQKIQSTGRSSGLSSFLKDKLENIKGTDQELLKSERINKCELKIKELEDAVATSDQVHIAFSKEVSQEFQIFEQSRTVDLKDALVTYAKSQVLFYKQSMELWQDVLPKLELESKQAKIDTLGFKNDAESLNQNTTNISASISVPENLYDDSQW